MKMNYVLPVCRLTSTAKLPKRGTEGAVGYDLYADEHAHIDAGERRRISTGISMMIPEHHYGRVAPRSGLAFNYGLQVLGGVIDPDYRGEVHVMLHNSGNVPVALAKGDRIAQIIIEAVITPEVAEVDHLDETVRGTAGYGSTGLR